MGSSTPSAVQENTTSPDFDKYLQNYIGGELIAPQSEGYIDNIEPATGQVYTHVPDSDQQDVQKAVQAAQKAFPDWAQTPAPKKAQHLQQLADAINDELDTFIQAESKDNGKPVSLARKVDIPRSISNLRFFAAGLQHFASEAHVTENRAVNYTLRQPLGVVGCISPWNLPLYLFTWKIAPAVATGNCIVAKPSEVTPLTAYLFSKACQRAHFPPGVINIVHGYGHKVGDAIVSHPDVKAVAFTGSTETGRAIAQKAAGSFKKVSLEMGGKNPNIIFDDCEFDTMLKTTIKSSFANQGQICLCGSRVFIQNSMYDKFKKAFLERTQQLTVGDPLDKETSLGAIVSKDHYEKILSYIELAQEEGGTILEGGTPVQLEGRCQNGYFIRPTVIEGLSNDCRTNQEEIFGPVVSLIPFETEEEVLKMANDSSYGLSATLWTEHLTRTHRMARQLETGILWVNCWLFRDLRTPFGGVKQSGYGSREGGWEIMRFFTEPKNVCIKT